MNIDFGADKTELGYGVLIELTGNEVALAIDAWLVAHNVHIVGPRTIRVNDELVIKGEIYIDPSGYVVHEGEKFDGRIK